MLNNGFWHIDLGQLILALPILWGAAAMWFSLREHPPHSHWSEGKRAHKIGSTIVTYPKDR